MVQNVYMASLAFFIPLKGIKRKYQNLCASKICIKTPFAHFPNAKCYYKTFENAKQSPVVCDHVFYYKSRYNSKDIIWRQITVKPFLLEFRLGKGALLRTLALLISVDKVFDKEKQMFNGEDFCTEFDLVNLKKAFLETFPNGLLSSKEANAKSHHVWIQDLLHEIEGIKRSQIIIPYSIIDVNVQRIELKDNSIDLKNLTELFKQGYYSDSSNTSIDDFLSKPIEVQGLTKQSTTPDGITIDERCFAYGLLYANDNFMMLHKGAMETVINNFYTNNQAEKFWADDGNIVHIITHTPFFQSSSQRTKTLMGDLGEVSCLLEMCMLIYLKCKLTQLKNKYNTISSEEIELSLEEIVDGVYGRLFNQTDYDKRMNYYKRMFCLFETLEMVRGITKPRKNILSMVFNRRNAFIASIIAVLTLIVTCFSLLISKT